MPTISGVIITKNEEKNIERCILSLQGIVDEVVIVDSYSDDATVDIAKRLGAKVYFKEFLDYSSSKNFANEQATSDYILSIDADEALSEELKAEILEEKIKGLKDGYIFKRKTNYCGQWILHGGWYPDTKLRIWKKGLANWSGTIHESNEYTGKKAIVFKGDLLHYSYDSIEVHAIKTNKYTTMEAVTLFAQNKKTSLLKIITSPVITFIKKYFFQLGCLDGYYGFVIAIMSSYYKFYKYAKLMDLWKRKAKDN